MRAAKCIEGMGDLLPYWLHLWSSSEGVEVIHWFRTQSRTKRRSNLVVEDGKDGHQIDL